MSRLLLGVDAGNTKTVALVVTENGAVLGSGRGRCGDIHNAAGPAAAVDQIVAASHAALDAAGGACIARVRRARRGAPHARAR